MFVIDYMNGSMGNTILSHILYSCGQVNIDFSNFFSKSGDAHKIKTLSRPRSLTARHLSNNPLGINEKCIITIVPETKIKALVVRMSYFKWFRKRPTLDNLEYFFDLTNNENTYIEKLESTAEKYYDLFLIKEPITNDSHILWLQEYLKQGVSDRIIDTLEEKLKWKWDYNKSAVFYKYMIKNNQQHLDWFENLTRLVDGTLTGNYIEYNLEFWEKAMFVALLCIEEQIHPSQLAWYNYQCLVNSNNQNLIENFKELKNGKTI